MTVATRVTMASSVRPARNFPLVPRSPYSASRIPRIRLRSGTYLAPMLGGWRLSISSSLRKRSVCVLESQCLRDEILPESDLRPFHACRSPRGTPGRGSDMASARGVVEELDPDGERSAEDLATGAAAALVTRNVAGAGVGRRSATLLKRVCGDCGGRRPCSWLVGFGRARSSALS